MVGFTPSTARSSVSKAVRPDREKFAEDDALGDAVGDTEAEQAGKLLQSVHDLALVAAGKRPDTVADHDPIQFALTGSEPIAAHALHQLGILAGCP